MFVNMRGICQRHLNDKPRILSPRDSGLEIDTLSQRSIIREIDWIISLRGMHCGKHEEKAHTGAGAPSHVLLPRITTRLPSPSEFTIKRLIHLQEEYNKSDTYHPVLCKAVSHDRVQLGKTKPYFHRKQLRSQRHWCSHLPFKLYS